MSNRRKTWKVAARSIWEDKVTWHKLWIKISNQPFQMRSTLSAVLNTIWAHRNNNMIKCRRYDRIKRNSSITISRELRRSCAQEMAQKRLKRAVAHQTHHPTRKNQIRPSSSFKTTQIYRIIISPSWRQISRQSRSAKHLEAPMRSLQELRRTLLAAASSQSDSLRPKC